MTGMERVIAALQGNIADRRAFTMTLSLYGAKLTNCPVTEYYTRPGSYLKGQAAVAERFGPDIIFAPFALALEARAFGTEINFLAKHPPNVKKPFLRNPNEIGRIRVPDIDRDESLRYLRASARLLADHFKGKVPICGVLTSPMDLPAIIMGAEGWLELLLFDREKASAVIAMMSEYFVRMANSMFDCGINFLAMAMVFNNPRIVFEKTIAETIVPALSDMFGKLKGPVVFHHGGIPLAGYLRLYRSLPNIGGYVLDSRDSFADARKIVGDKVLLMGNLDGPSLARISTAKAIEKARKILDDRKEDRHFIFATSAADVAWDTPFETIAGIRELMRRYENGP
jgi:uroporphyrinogen decarboxylase